MQVCRYYSCNTYYIHCIMLCMYSLSINCCGLLLILVLVLVLVTVESVVLDVYTSTVIGTGIVIGISASWQLLYCLVACIYLPTVMAKVDAGYTTV